MKILTTEEFKQKLDSGDKFIVDFYGYWCYPCKLMEPIMESANKKLEENNHEVKLYKFDVDSDRELAMDLGIRAVPTIKVFKDGNEVDSYSGVLQETKLLEIADSII